MSTQVTSLSLANIRPFSGEQHVQLSRMTLLVGENSVGKSTFLGYLNAIGRLSSLNGLDDHVNVFNQKPFCMGSFSTLARSGCTSFRAAIGMDNGPFHQFAIEFAQGSDGALKETVLELQMFDSSLRPGEILTIVRETPEIHPERWHFDGPNFQFRLNQSEVSYVQFTTWLSRSIAHGVLPFGGSPTEFRKRVAHSSREELVNFTKFVNFFRQRFRSKCPKDCTPIALYDAIEGRMQEVRS